MDITCPYCGLPENLRCWHWLATIDRDGVLELDPVLQRAFDYLDPTCKPPFQRAAAGYDGRLDLEPGALATDKLHDDPAVQRFLAFYCQYIQRTTQAKEFDRYPGPLQSRSSSGDGTSAWFTDIEDSSRVDLASSLMATEPLLLAEIWRALDAAASSNGWAFCPFCGELAMHGDDCEHYLYYTYDDAQPRWGDWAGIDDWFGTMLTLLSCEVHLEVDDEEDEDEVYENGRETQGLADYLPGWEIDSIDDRYVRALIDGLDRYIIGYYTPYHEDAYVGLDRVESYFEIAGRGYDITYFPRGSAGSWVFIADPAEVTRVAEAMPRATAWIEAELDQRRLGSTTHDPNS